MAKSKKKNIKVRDLNPKKDAKGGGGFKQQGSQLQGSVLQGSSQQGSYIQGGGKPVN